MLYVLLFCFEKDLLYAVSVSLKRVILLPQLPGSGSQMCTALPGMLHVFKLNLTNLLLGNLFCTLSSECFTK